jgi:hypothetical protein
LLGRLLGFVGNIGVLQCSLETTGYIVGVLVAVISACLNVTELVLKDFSAVLLGFFGGV